MGAISAGVPAIYVPGGPMLKGNFCGTTLGRPTARYWAERVPEPGRLPVRGDRGRDRPLPGHCHDHGDGLDDDDCGGAVERGRDAGGVVVPAVLQRSTQRAR